MGKLSPQGFWDLFTRNYQYAQEKQQKDAYYKQQADFQARQEELNLLKFGEQLKQNEIDRRYKESMITENEAQAKKYEQERLNPTPESIDTYEGEYTNEQNQRVAYNKVKGEWEVLGKVKPEKSSTTEPIIKDEWGEDGVKITRGQGKTITSKFYNYDEPEKLMKDFLESNEQSYIRVLRRKLGGNPTAAELGGAIKQDMKKYKFSQKKLESLANFLEYYEKFQNRE